MKYFILGTFALSLFLHQPVQITYEEAIKICREERSRKQQELLDNGRQGLVFQGMDCIFNVNMPSFESKTLDGRTVDTSYFKGKTTILNFWFIGCKPCVAEIPGFNALVEKYGTKDFHYLAIGRDSSADIEEFLQKHPWKFDIIPDGTAIIEDTFQTMWGFPTTMVIDENGMIVEGFYGGKTDEAAIQEIQEKVAKIIANM